MRCLELVNRIEGLPDQQRALLKQRQIVRARGVFGNRAAIAASAEVAYQWLAAMTWEGNDMNDEQRLKYLKSALLVFGVVFVVGVPAMMMWIFPSGWSWMPRQPEYEQMIMGMYAVLGVFLIRAAKDPLANLSLIWFTVWSSAVHAAIMLAQAIMDETERANLVGDIPALFLVAAVFWYLTPRKSAAG